LSLAVMTSAEFLLSPVLQAAGFRHAFFTRRGGISTGPFASLSFSTSVGDEAAHVEENLRRAALALEVEPEHVYFLSQVHGSTVEAVDSRSDRRSVWAREGDALMSRDPKVACGVRSADCVPILMGDRSSGAVVAIHAGWRGTVRGVIAAAVTELRRVVGADGDLVAAIGPHISLEAFEVSDEVAAELLRASPDPDVVSRAFGPKPHVDLRRIVRGQLQALGLAPENVDDVMGCTLREPDRFFSFRGSGPRSGRHLSAIVAKR
jgi:YfiH family protein